MEQCQSLPRASLRQGQAEHVQDARRSALSPSTAEVSPVALAGAPHGSLPLARSEPSLPTRRDTRFAASYPAAGRHSMCPVIWIRAPCASVPHEDSRGITGSGGQELTDRAWERFAAHTACRSAPLQGGTPTSSGKAGIALVADQDQAVYRPSSVGQA